MPAIQEIFPNRVALDLARPPNENVGKTALIGEGIPYEIRQSDGQEWVKIHTPFAESLRCVSTNTAFPNNFASASKQANANDSPAHDHISC